MFSTIYNNIYNLQQIISKCVWGALFVITILFIYFTNRTKIKIHFNWFFIFFLYIGEKKKMNKINGSRLFIFPLMPFSYIIQLKTLATLSLGRCSGTLLIPTFPLISREKMYTWLLSYSFFFNAANRTKNIYHFIKNPSRVINQTSINFNIQKE